MQSKLRFFASLLLVFSLSLFMFLSISQSLYAASPNKVKICHVTASETNRYIYIEVSSKAVDDIGGQSDHTSHSHDGLFDLWTGDGRESVINGPNDCPGGAVFVKEIHEIVLEPICHDLIKNEYRWEVYNQDSSDLFYPVTLALDNIGNNILTEDFEFSNKIDNPFKFTTSDSSDSKVKIFWYKAEKDKWKQADQSNPATVACEVPLAISKEAFTSYTKTWVWDIKKVADTDSIEVELGKSKEVNYTVTLTPSPVFSNYKVSGTVTVFNPNSSSVKIKRVTDIIRPDEITVNLECEESFPYMLSGEDSFSCSYVQVLPDGLARRNVAKVITNDELLNNRVVKNFDFISTNPLEVDNCILISDDKNEDLEREVCIGDEYSFEYSLEIEGEKCGESEYTNTVTGIINDTEIEDSVTIDISVGGEKCLPVEKEEEEEDDDDDGDVLPASTTAVGGTGEVLGTKVVMAATAGEDTTLLYLIQYVLILLTGASLLSLGNAYYNRR